MLYSYDIHVQYSRGFCCYVPCSLQMPRVAMITKLKGGVREKAIWRGNASYFVLVKKGHASYFVLLKKRLNKNSVHFFLFFGGFYMAPLISWSYGNFSAGEYLRCPFSIIWIQSFLRNYLYNLFTAYYNAEALTYSMPKILTFLACTFAWDLNYKYCTAILIYKKIQKT
jgi:hypothetical protein